jgi:two-component system LytT family response regulator
MIKTVIIEDERASQELLGMKLSTLFPEIKIVNIIDNVDESVTYLSREEVDLVFMDNQIKGGFASDILNKLPNDLTLHIIYITAFSEYAIEALNRGAAYYLLKPFREDELITAVQRVLLTLNERKNIIQISGSGKNQMVSISEVLYIESQGTYSIFHLVSGRLVVSSKNLGYFESILPKDTFFRIHHSIIVNMGFIDSVLKGKNPQVILKPHGKHLGISQRKAPVFYATLKGFHSLLKKQNTY